MYLMLIISNSSVLTNYFVKTLIATYLICASYSTFALTPKVVQTNNIQFWTESFGNKNNPPILLIMGVGGQGLLWPQKFCEQLAEQGYFVIRYDHRDTGLSSTIDFNQTPYTMLDLAKDAVAILDGYQISQANIVGSSMGGEIAMLIAAHYPSYVRTLTLLMTTTDMRPVFDTMQGIESNSPLSKPTLAVQQIANKSISDPKLPQDKLALFMEIAQVNAGQQIPIDVDFFHEAGLQHLARTKNHNGVRNHFAAIMASYDLHQAAPPQIKAPTVIIHGDQDPVFGLDHATALNKAIPNSKLIIVPGLGHGITNQIFYEPIIASIQQIIKNLKS